MSFGDITQFFVYTDPNILCDNCVKQFHIINVQCMKEFKYLQLGNKISSYKWTFFKLQETSLWKLRFCVHL